MRPNREVTRDLSRKLQEGLAVVLERDLKVAQVVLEPNEIGVLFLEAAVMMVRSSAATVAGMCGPADVERIYDLTIESIFEQAKMGRADAVRRTQTAIAPRSGLSS